ncbi:hypothetical protein D9M68_157900 [compost metagenome]|uniref:Sigma E regulatory protein, MucB/RseB n=1 Tax=Pseudomonas jinjuensis TaxID=198616 RepID=A0A1H0R444_9PSED|nr:DUF1329 domain-containing protein [Pseudomonas jinjuensis]SDP24304.1 Protein of unknown function [Pseudomonas jinjuensis]
MKTTTKRIALAVTLAACSSLSLSALAKVSPEEAARLGKDLTCVGGERAGNADGTIPEFTGQYIDEVPGWKHQLYSGDKPVDPFVDEKPRLVIDASNYRQQADHLTPGQMAMFEKYPETYKIEVYPGKRIFGYPKFVCDNAKWGAENNELTDNGLGIKGLGQAPFPIPKSGAELVWNHLLAPGAWIEDVIRSIASVLPDGSIGWGRTHNRNLSPNNSPNERPTTDGVRSYAWNISLAPVREAGTNTVAQEFYNWAGRGRLAWSYNPGTRRVRMLPGFGFDQPMIGTNGTMTIDDDRMFNGSPERYEWKNLGKKEIYVPINAYKVNSNSVKYADLLTPHHPRPEFLRYELRRVWVLEGTLKEGYRHLYGKRVLFLDEDTWNALMADNYDARGKLWKHSITSFYYHPDSKSLFSGVQFSHDLNSGQYVAYSLTNEEARGPILNNASLKPEMFTPDALRAQGR